MEISVAKGLGYITVESRESDKHEIGYIEMDSIFSPILSVGINVENVRVGKMTNWDKLILDIVTDGTVTPEEVFNQAVEILINQFNALVGKTQGAGEPTAAARATGEKEEVPAEIEEEKKVKKRGRPKKQ